VTSLWPGSRGNQLCPCRSFPQFCSLTFALYIPLTSPHRGKRRKRIKKRRQAILLQLVVSLSPCCDVPFCDYHGLRIIGLLTFVCTRNTYIIAKNTPYVNSNLFSFFSISPHQSREVCVYSGILHGGCQSFCGCH